MARSLYSSPGKSSSEFASLRSKLTEELSHSRSSPSPTHRSRHGSQEEVSAALEMAHPSATNTGSGGGPGQCVGGSAKSAEGSAQSVDRSVQFAGETAPSADTAMENIYNMGMLQSKIMSLQGEALRVTYAIDYVNECMAEWLQHKEDFKRAVQRRCAQFQFFIKRLEHQLLAQVDDKRVDDDFYTLSDKSKAELRNVLKNILHEVSVLKNIQELGRDDEINSLRHDLLGRSVGMASVTLTKFHYEMEVPTENIEELVATCFGEVKLNPEDSNVFVPEITDFSTDFTEVSMADVVQQASEEGLSSSSDREISILEDEEQGGASDRSGAMRSFSDSSYTKYSTDFSLNDQTRQHLAQFQTARETLRTRRREILVRGQKAREGTSSLMDEFQVHPRSALRRGRVHSLDRTAPAVVKRSSKRELATKANMPATTEVTLTSGDDKSSRTGTHVRVGGPEPSHVLPHGHGSSHFSHGLITENINIPSPLTEEISFPGIPERKLVKQTSDPFVVTENATGSDVCLPTQTQSVMENLNSRQFLDPTGNNLFPQRRHSSDQYTLVANGDNQVLDLLHDKAFTRPVRKAISSVANKKQKMEILRENWQKRKEILIQNEGFVSADSLVKFTSKPSGHIQIQDISGSRSVFIGKGPQDTESHMQTASDDLSCQGEEFQHKKELTTTEETRPEDTSATMSSQQINSITRNGDTASDLPAPLQPLISSYQTENRTDITAPSEAPQEINLASSPQHQPRQYFYDLISGDRVSRRHSTDTISVSPDIQLLDPTSLGTSYHKRLMDDYRNSVPSSENNITQLPLAKSTDTNGATEEIVRSSETSSTQSQPDQGTMSETSTALSVILPSSSLPQAPPSPTASDGVQKLKLREIARKKKERWRHLTIH